MDEVLESGPNELDSLFAGTGAASDSNTPNVVTFKSEEPIVEEPEERKKKKRERKKGPKKPYQRKKQKKTYDDDMSDFIVQDSPGSLLASLAQQQAPPPDPETDPAFIEREKKKKAKASALQHAVFCEMKQQGKGDNDIKAELKRIERLSEDDLEFEVQKVAWTQSEHFSDKVAHVIRDGTGWLADRLLSGEGKIQKEFEEDRALKAAFQKQMLGLVGSIGPTTQIALLSLGNIMNGKAKAMSQPPTINIPPNNNNNNNNKDEPPRR